MSTVIYDYRCVPPDLAEVESRMPLTRRRLLLGAAAIPALAGLERAGRSLGGLAVGAIRAARPPADGTSATRCARCGARDHAMLDACCPAAPKVT